MTELETRQPLPRKRVGPERAALVLAMAVVSGLAMIQQAPTRREMASGARAEACLLTAKVETTLVCVRAWLESQGHDTGSRLLDAAGFSGQHGSRALAEAAAGQYEDALQNRPEDWQARANAAILYGYLGRDHDGVVLLREGLATANLGGYWFLFRIYAREAPKQEWLKSAQLASMRRLPAGPLLLARLYTDLGQPEKASGALQEGFRRGLRLMVAFSVLLALGVAGLGIWVVFLAVRPWRRPAPGPAATWSVFQAVEVLVVWMFVSLMAVWAADVIFSRRHPSAAVLDTGLYVIAGAVALLWFFIMSTEGERQTASAVGWRSGRGVLSGLAGYCATLPLLALAWLALRSFLPDSTPASPALPLVTGATGLLDRALVIALALLIAPVFEETLFRGILYGGLRRRMRPALAMTVSSLIFGLAHLDLVGALPLAAIGMVLAYLYERTGSLAGPAVAHALVNAGTVALAMVV